MDKGVEKDLAALIGKSIEAIRVKNGKLYEVFSLQKYRSYSPA